MVGLGVVHGMIFKWMFKMKSSVLFFSLLLSFAANAASPKTGELHAACVQNPSHSICKKIAERKQAMKDKREAKLQAQIDAVRSNKE